MSAAKALPQAPITMTNEATNLCADNQCMPVLIALPRVSLGPCVIQVQSAVFGCHSRGTMNRKRLRLGFNFGESSYRIPRAGLAPPVAMYHAFMRRLCRCCFSAAVRDDSDLPARVLMTLSGHHARRY